MKQITIIIPDNCELEKDGNTYTIVIKEQPTYGDIARELFSHKDVFWITERGSIMSSGCGCPLDLNNCTSQKQAEKLLALNKLMNVAKRLNGDWQPDWSNFDENKHYIQICNNSISVSSVFRTKSGDIYFKSKELAQKAIKILGEKTIKLALCTDY